MKQSTEINQFALFFNSNKKIHLPKLRELDGTEHRELRRKGLYPLARETCVRNKLPQLCQQILASDLEKLKQK